MTIGTRAGAVLALVIAMLILLPYVALATVTVYLSCDGPVPGICGFVGKGDVQALWGWNNPVIQREAPYLSFDYINIAQYDVTCEWDTEAGHASVHHVVTIPRSIHINDTVAYDARTHKQVDGFYLTGLSGPSGGTVPQVGDSCPGNHPGLVTAVTGTELVNGIFVTDLHAGTGPTQLPITYLLP